MAGKRDRITLEESMRVLRDIERNRDYTSKQRTFLMARQYRIVIHLLVQAVLRLEKIVNAWRPN